RYVAQRSFPRCISRKPIVSIEPVKTDKFIRRSQVPLRRHQNDFAIGQSESPPRYLAEAFDLSFFGSCLSCFTSALGSSCFVGCVSTRCTSLSLLTTSITRGSSDEKLPPENEYSFPST